MSEKQGFSVKKFYWQLMTLLGLGILFLNPVNSVLGSLGIQSRLEMPLQATPANANEIYPMFNCPCCGQPLNKEEPCCGAMVQIIDFIDKKISTGAVKDEVVLATAQEFGLERLVSELDRETLKAKLLANAPKNAPKINLEESKQDLGTVSQSDGTVTTEFTVKNEGESDLIIDKLSSSCGCTSGSIVYQSQEGPRFYMSGHGYEEPDPNWQVSIAPGDTATVKVYYDPTVHEDLTGPVTRTMSIHSNDPVEFEKKVTINLTQTR